MIQLPAANSANSHSERRRRRQKGRRPRGLRCSELSADSRCKAGPAFVTYYGPAFLQALGGSLTVAVVFEAGS